jgi:hypothetical protein
MGDNVKNATLRALAVIWTAPALLLITLATSLAWPNATESKDSVELSTKVSVELPTNETPFPPGKGAEITPQCLVCHSADMVLRQPPLTPSEWAGEINKMRNAYGAPLPASQVEDLARYLCSINGRQCSSGG